MDVGISNLNASGQGGLKETKMGKDAWGSKAGSVGYSHSGPKPGAPVVMAGGPGGGKAGIKAAKGKTVEAPDAAASSSTPKGLKSYKEGKGVKI
jgi:hypothetical protein